MELRGDAGVFLSSRLPAAQQRQEEFGEGGAVAVGLHGRVSRVRQGKWKDGGVAGCETTGTRVKHGGER